MIVTTIIVMICLIWNIIAFSIVIKDDSIFIHDCDSLFEKIAKIYLWLIITLFLFLVLLIISVAIAKPIWCDISNNDDKICEKVDVKNDE